MSATQPGEFNPQEFTDLGDPLIGGRLYTYVFGTTTHKTAFTDAAASVAHTYTADGLGGQYIAFNARGELPAPLYLTTGSYDLALKRADGSTVWTRRADPTGDVIIAAPLLMNIGFGVTNLTASNAGLLLIDASGGNVTVNLPQASAATGVTFQLKRIDATANTVTVNRAAADTIDGATSFLLDARYSYKEIRSDGVNAWRFLSDLGSGAGADIASAAALDLTTRSGNIVRITGSSGPITSVAMNNGDQVVLIVVSTPTFTYHATNMPLQGGVSYTCSAGDVLIFTKDKSGVLTIQIIKVDGTATVVASQVPIGAVEAFAMNVAPTGWLKANGAAVSRSTYAALFAALYKSAVVTTPIASPGVVNWTAHGRSVNDPIRFTTTGALPTGLVAGTTYYVISAGLATDSFRLSATPGGAAINFTGATSGVHTGIHAPWGIGDGSTTFNVPDMRGEFPRGWDDSRAVDANRAFGSAQAGQMSSHTHTISVSFSDTFYNAGANPAGVPSTTDTASRGVSPVTASGSATSAGGTENSNENRPRNISLLYCIKF
jgi:microcystin-dependent protein